MSFHELSINQDSQDPENMSLESSKDQDAIDDNIMVPELPKQVQPDMSLANEAGEWIEKYIEYASTITPLTPREFHLGAGLWTISVGIARRLFVQLPFGSLYPNTYVLWISPSTLFRKTTSQDIATLLVKAAYPNLLSPHELTPEALIADMAGKAPSNYDELTESARNIWEARRSFSAQKGLALDEFSSLMKGMEKDYNHGLLEMYLRGYDCAPQYERLTRVLGLTSIHNIYWSILGASTPSALAQYFQRDMYWTNGFWPRFFLITPKELLPWKEAKEMTRPQVLVDGLTRLYRRLPEAKWPVPPQALQVSMSSEAHELWLNYSRALSYDLIVDQPDDRLKASYGRFPAHVIKVATILSAIDTDKPWPPSITLPHLHKAILICEEFRASLHRVIAFRSEQTITGYLFRVIKLIAKYAPGGASIRDISSGMRDRSRTDINEYIEELVSMNIIRANESKPTSAGGRPTTKYVLGAK